MSSVIPVLIAITFTVELCDRVNGDEYRAEPWVGVLPSVV
jgi:hypothetical protein